MTDPTSDDPQDPLDPQDPHEMDTASMPDPIGEPAVADAAVAADDAVDADDVPVVHEEPATDTPAAGDTPPPDESGPSGSPPGPESPSPRRRVVAWVGAAALALAALGFAFSVGRATAPDGGNSRMEFRQTAEDGHWNSDVPDGFPNFGDLPDAPSTRIHIDEAPDGRPSPPPMREHDDDHDEDDEGA